MTAGRGICKYTKRDTCDHSSGICTVDVNSSGTANAFESLDKSANPFPKCTVYRRCVNYESGNILILGIHK